MSIWRQRASKPLILPSQGFRQQKPTRAGAAHQSATLLQVPINGILFAPNPLLNRLKSMDADFSAPSKVTFFATLFAPTEFCMS